MLRDGLSFKAAAQALGAWDVPETDYERSARGRREAQQRAEKARAEAAKAEERERRLKARAELLELIAIERQAVERLRELHQGAPTESPDEVERCYEVASLLIDQIREADAEYITAAGLECEP